MLVRNMKMIQLVRVFVDVGGLNARRNKTRYLGAYNTAYHYS